MVYPALLPLMRTPRLPVVDWTDVPADLNGLVRFAERRNLVSTRMPSHFNWPLFDDDVTAGRTFELDTHRRKTLRWNLVYFNSGHTDGCAIYPVIHISSLLGRLAAFYRPDSFSSWNTCSGAWIGRELSSVCRLKWCVCVCVCVCVYTLFDEWKSKWHPCQRSARDMCSILMSPPPAGMQHHKAYHSNSPFHNT